MRVRKIYGPSGVWTPPCNKKKGKEKGGGGMRSERECQKQRKKNQHPPSRLFAMQIILDAVVLGLHSFFWCAFCCVAVVIGGEKEGCQKKFFFLTDTHPFPLGVPFFLKTRQQKKTQRTAIFHFFHF